MMMTIKVTKEAYKKLKETAHKKGIKMHEVVDGFLNVNKAKPKQKKEEDTYTE